MRECLQDCGIPFCLWVLGHTSTAGTSEQVSLLVASYRASFEYIIKRVKLGAYLREDIGCWHIESEGNAL